MPSLTSLVHAVDDAFVETGRGLAPWPDPHPDRSPTDDEYSRVSDPSKWRIISARAAAWTLAIETAGLAAVERDVEATWLEGRPFGVTRADRLLPVAAGARPVVLARTSIDDTVDFGVVIGFADPAVVVTRLPWCGCDACDDGSAATLRELDDRMLDIVTGVYRQRAQDRRRSHTYRAGSSSGWASGTPSRTYDLVGAPWLM